MTEQGISTFKVIIIDDYTCLNYQFSNANNQTLEPY